jgi:hypothetical protein
MVVRSQGHFKRLFFCCCQKKTQFIDREIYWTLQLRCLGQYGCCYFDQMFQVPACWIRFSPLNLTAFRLLFSSSRLCLYLLFHGGLKLGRSHWLLNVVEHKAMSIILLNNVTSWCTVTENEDQFLRGTLSDCSRSSSSVFQEGSFSSWKLQNYIFLTHKNTALIYKTVEISKRVDSF